LRELAGSGDSDPSVELEEAGNMVLLKFANPTDTSQHLTLRALAYDQRRPVTITLKPGQTQIVRRDVSASHHWYDLFVTGDKGFVGRFAGHVETGKPSWSDPAMGTLVTV
jgi:phospholipase C